jgi:DNA polymerase III delta prime subunit
MTREQFLWVEKYRPQTVADTILPLNLKDTFNTFVEDKVIPNLLLVGGPGMGKTTVARAMCEQLGCDYIVINGSMKGNIDTLRNEILNFASTMSLFGGRKYVILDEADYLNPQSTQPALRNFMEDFSSNCGFILTANFAQKIIEPLHSRCSVVEFKFLKKDIPELGMQLLKRVSGILKTEGVSFERPVVAELISQFFPDFRRVINELQRYSAQGHIDTGILANIKQAEIESLIALIKKKNWTDARAWIAQNVDDANVFFTALCEYVKDKPQIGPAVIILAANYQYKHSFVANKEINLSAFVAELMMEELF